MTEIIRHYLKRKVRGMQGDEFVEDLVQEVLLTIHLKKGTYNRELPFLPWVYAVTRHRLIDAIRSETRRHKFFEVWDLEQDPDQLSPEFLVRDFLDGSYAVEHLLSAVPDRQKEILYLSKVEELPLKEIARQMKMTLTAVKVTIHRAIRTIRGGEPNKGSDENN